MRKFDLPDGTLIEVDSDKATRWKSNTCQCYLVFEPDTLELDFAIEVCQEHKDIPDTILVSTVLAHNNSINTKFGVGKIPTLQQKKLIGKDRENESKRIRAKGAPEVRADKNKKAEIETKLKSRGR